MIYYDTRMLGHNPHGWDPGHPAWTDAVKAMIALQYPSSNLETYSHPERPDRLTAIVDRLMLDPIEGVRWMLPTAASTAQLERVHDKTYVAHIESLEGESCWLAKDTTAVSPGSVEAARLAAGSGNQRCRGYLGWVRPGGRSVSCGHQGIMPIPAAPRAFVCTTTLRLPLPMRVRALAISE
ncbi:MAG: hypothetical protein U5K56_00300 [Halioglobus sp.]|nr:hypothetical protein [Halioglobus sp.]